VNDLAYLLESATPEACVIAAALNNPSLLHELKLTREMFQNHLFGQLWESMLDMDANGEPVSPTTVATAKADVISRIGVHRFAEIASTYVAFNQAQVHAKRIREAHLKNKVRQLAENLQRRTLDMECGVDELRNDAEQISLLLSEMSAEGGLVSGPHVAIEWIHSIEQKAKDPNSVYGMMTGWREVDAVTLGWHRGDLIVVGGRTSVGKTAVSIENLIRLQKQGYKVAMFSLEMSREQVQNRIATNISGVPFQAIRLGRLNPGQLEAVTSSAVTEAISNIAIDDRRGLTADEIAAEMKAMKRTKGLDFVVVDYLQEIVEPERKNDNNGSALARVARKLRKAAKECDCAVMALSQLNRDAEGKPQLKHLSGSSGIESAADVIVLLHRDKEEEPNTLYFNIAKQRNGPTKEVKLQYDLQLQRLSGQ
jgi:replicative DNA helicase